MAGNICQHQHTKYLNFERQMNKDAITKRKARLLTRFRLAYYTIVNTAVYLMDAGLLSF